MMENEAVMDGCLALVAFRGYFFPAYGAVAEFLYFRPFSSWSPAYQKDQESSRRILHTCLYVFEPFKVVLDVSV